jgi:hypothetical protein
VLSFGAAFFVALAHALAMTLSGRVIAGAIYFWFGLDFQSRRRFNFDFV